MRDKYDQTAASQPMELEEIESPRTLDTISNWALSPSARMSFFWFAMGGGLAMAIVGLKRPSDFLVVAGIALLFGGYGGMNLLRERLDAYEIGVHYTRREKPSQTAVPMQEQVKVNTSRGSYTESKRRADVQLAYGRDSQFVFTGRNLDKMLTWLQEQGRGVRKVGSAEGLGFSDLPDGIHAENYTNAIAALTEWEYVEKQGQSNRWTQAGIDWLKMAGL